MKKLSFLDKFIFLVNSVLATLLLLSYCLPLVSPKTIPFFTILSLFVPILLLLNLLFIIYWLLKLKKQFFLSTLIISIGLFVSKPFFKISSENSALNNDLKIMSYNVKAFDLFFKKGVSNGLEFIKSKNPDILCIQEYFSSSKIKINYPYQYVKKKGNFGMAIYSKFKIINSGSLDLAQTSNNIIFADVLKNNDTIRVYNTHFESLRIKPNEENFGEKDSEKLFIRLSSSFKKQAVQTAVFLAHEQNWLGKKIISGDFNNTAYSWMYHQISKNKKDAFIEAGKGFGKTFNYFFPLRIDYILTDKNAIINKFVVYNEEFSDHYPILARVNW